MRVALRKMRAMVNGMTLSAEPMLAVHEVAILLGVSTATVRRLDDRLRPMRVGGARVYRVADVVEVIPELAASRAARRSAK